MSQIMGAFGQLFQTVRTLEAELRQVVRVSLSMGVKEDESNTGCIWATIANSENARSRMEASPAGKCEYGDKGR
jgi:hypothetical protein